MNNTELDIYIESLISNQHSIYNQNQELIFSQVFHDTIKGSSWLPKNFPFSPGRGALGYPALYVLYRILDELKPNNILEMGMGQSTKMIGLYNHKHSSCIHEVVEHDPEWISFFCNHFELPKTTHVVQLPIVEASINLGEAPTDVIIYNGFYEKFKDKKYDFICIDGPYGFNDPEYSRIDIFNILPECLNERFVILLDDCDRLGEENTFNLIKSTLSESNIPHSSTIYQGEKGTGLIVSKDLAFMCSM
ncbi:MAG: hypothetical protein K6G76_07460 [Lachnospiraceae bacterium]|nr:hypothetical protein [Lachnospiraceae bacterium]